jgi:hypothetical protein
MYHKGYEMNAAYFVIRCFILYPCVFTVWNYCGCEWMEGRNLKKRSAIVRRLCGAGAGHQSKWRILCLYL